MRNLTLILFSFAFSGCGTLGGFALWKFPASKQVVVQAIDTLFTEHPEYIVPDKWTKYDDWKSRGFDFLDSRIFYFKQIPEEMYYVTFIGDANDSIQANPNETGISIRAVSIGTPAWITEDKTNSAERKRIETRFTNEITAKLESYTNTKTTKEN